MEMSLKENGSLTKPTAMEYIFMLMVQDMKVVGKMTCKMAME